MADQKVILELEAFGLNAIEAKIYLHLLNRQPKTILEIARELRLARTSVYDNSLKLSEKGLIQKIIKYKSQKLKAYPLTILQELIDKERLRIDDLQSGLTNLEKKLSQTALPQLNTEVRYFQGKEGLQQMMWNMLLAEDKKTIGYTVFRRIDVVGEKFIKRWQDEIKRLQISDRVITNGEHYGGEIQTVYPEPLQEIRSLAKDRFYLSGDTTIYNNVFAVCYWKQGEVVGVEIENAELVKTQKSIFEELWKLAEPIEKYIDA